MSDRPNVTTIVNLRESPSCDIRIDRSSKWGNPFRIGPDGGRSDVILKYSQWIQHQDHLLRALSELDGKVLGCWCKPFPCHGDVLLSLLDARRNS